MSHSLLTSHVEIPRPEVLERKIDSPVPDEEQVVDVDPVTVDHASGSRVFDVSGNINDQVNLEVSIRERLATTIEGRIQWALQMLDALSNTKELQDQLLDEDDFRDAALDALEALETPTSFIFETGFPEERSPSPSISPIMPNQPVISRMPRTRSSRTPKPSQQKKHLYIKLPSTTSDCRLAILACPTCNRTQFTTLQGLLNHARLAHGIEWASHDACITACAIIISADDQGWEDGVEVPWGDNIVGLRRLFERAVGVDGTLPVSLGSYTAVDASLQDLATAPSTLLSRTLGLHADSPALAQFLGRTPKRRCIHVYDEDQHVDITTLDGSISQSDVPVFEEPGKSKMGFSMRYPHRNTARKDYDLVVEVGIEGQITNADNTSPSAIIPAGTTASRFHVTARIRLEDRSLFLKADRRAQLGITDQYRWMLGVTAPSYSLPLSSFLTCVTVVPPRSVSPVFLTVRQQPFAVIGTANKPFMAQIIFEWVGGAKMEVEHWIDLDQSKSHTSVLGSEQLLDIELDRNTPLLPPPKGSPPLPSLDRQLDSSLYNTPQIDSEQGETPAIKEEYYEQVLRSLLPRVPVTAKDVKPKMTTQVPYKLVAGPAQLLALVLGRRKAIEWARARALHSLYIDYMASAPPYMQTSLTVGDVYMFLEDASHFPRPSHPTAGALPVPKKKRREKDGTPILSDEACPACGVKKRLHPGYDVKCEEGAVPWTCAVVPATEQRYGARLPLTNLTKVLTWPDGLEQALLGPPFSPTNPGDVPRHTLKMFLLPFQHTPHDLVMLNPPELIIAVHKILSKLHLPTFPKSAPYGDNPTLLPKKEYIERCFAPVALLSATLKPFISTLLRSAIEIAKRDATTIISGTKNSRAKRTKKLTFVLTPGHILRGLRLRPSNSLKVVPSAARTVMNGIPRTSEPTTLSLARLGVRLGFGQDVPAGLGASTAEHQGHANIKAEPE